MIGCCVPAQPLRIQAHRLSYDTATEATHEIDKPSNEWNLRISTYYLNHSTLKLALRRKEELNRTDYISDIIVSPRLPSPNSSRNNRQHVQNMAQDAGRVSNTWSPLIVHLQGSC
jgi:hypothetical protein